MRKSTANVENVYVTIRKYCTANSITANTPTQASMKAQLAGNNTLCAILAGLNSRELRTLNLIYKYRELHQ